MENKSTIITVGLAPAWDITCTGRNLEWGRHQNIDEQLVFPAGKALNVSRALAWIGQRSIATGIWGKDDYEQMLGVCQSLWPLIEVNMTIADGTTRKNITIVDSANQKEMHLRNKTKLLNKHVLSQLKSELAEIVKNGDYCVFAGALPDNEYLDDVIGIIEQCFKTGAKIVLDTSGKALKRILETGLIWLINPNESELFELIGSKTENKSDSLIQAGSELLSKVDNLLISRAKEGAIFLNKEGIWQSKAINCGEVISTVGCGDYLLAGFLNGWKETQREDYALSIAIKLASAKALGWEKERNWQEILDNVQIQLSRLK